MKSGAAEIDLGVPAEDVWQALVAPGRRRWFFDLTPEGEFEAGRRILWTDHSGRAAVESDVAEVSPRRRLVLRDHLVFAPNLAANAPHEKRWEIAPIDSG